MLPLMPRSDCANAALRAPMLRHHASCLICQRKIHARAPTASARRRDAAYAEVIARCRAKDEAARTSARARDPPRSGAI